MNVESMSATIVSVFIISVAVFCLASDYNKLQLDIVAVKQGLEQKAIYKEGQTVQKIWVKIRVKKCIK